MTRGCSPNFKMCHMNEQTAWNERIIENEDALNLQNLWVSTDPPQVTKYICWRRFIAGTCRPNSFHPKGKSNLEGSDDVIIMINDQQEVVILVRKALKKGRAYTCTPVESENDRMFVLRMLHHLCYSLLLFHAGSYHPRRWFHVSTLRFQRPCFSLMRSDSCGLRIHQQVSHSPYQQGQQVVWKTLTHPTYPWN